jgi:hypothetical protein
LEHNGCFTGMSEAIGGKVIYQKIVSML